MADNPDLETAYAVQTPEDNLKLYRDWAKTYDVDFVEATTYRLPEVVARTYLEAGGGSPCLDVGCGTGVLAEHFPTDVVLDGVDISPEMLAVAEHKNHYRRLIEANLKDKLDIADASYAGLVSSGTFTHGHVGPEALPELVRVLAPNAVAVITVRPQVWDDKGFDRVSHALCRDGLITDPHKSEELVYADPTSAPKGHGMDTGYVVIFRRL